MDWKKVTLTINQMTSDAVINIMKDLGAQGVVVEETSEEYCDIIVYYPASDSFSQFLQSLKKRVNNLSRYDLDISGWEIKVETTSDENWATSWHKYFKPVKIGKSFEICPAWAESEFSRPYLIKIFPGRAFGIGGHESTQLALINLENYLESYFENLQDIKMMDIGTGTGILAIAAARMGVGSICALDKDEAAVQAAEENIELNKVDKKVNIIKQNIKNDLETNIPFDLITANLLPDIIINLLPLFVKYLTDGGLLILSGIVDQKREKIISLFRENNLNSVDEITKNNWSSFVLKRG